MLRAFSLLWISFFTFTSGCQEAPPERPPVAPRLAASKLSILVVNDPPLAAGIKLLRGEWAERSGGQLEIEVGTLDQLLDATELSVDLVLYPSRYVGTLVDRNWLRPVRKSVLQSVDVATNDMFPLIRNATLPYGDQVYGLTLGEPPLMLAGEALQEKTSSWERVDYRLTKKNSSLKYPRAAELLVRGTAYAQHRSRVAGWFDVETMQPQIASPPFVKALQQMLENEKSNADSQASISWPSTLRNNSSELTSFAPLPQAEQVYNPLRQIWEKNEADHPQVFLGFAGRSVSVTRSTRNSASAFKLLKWLITENIATQLSPRSDATIWFRKSQTAKAGRWLSKNGTGNETAAAVSKLLSSNNFFLLPRIPGIDKYLQALEEAISQGLPVEQALATAAEEWNTITDRYDRNRQRVAYRKHLGLEDL